MSGDERLVRALVLELAARYTWPRLDERGQVVDTPADRVFQEMLQVCRTPDGQRYVRQLSPAQVGEALRGVLAANHAALDSPDVPGAEQDTETTAVLESVGAETSVTPVVS